MDSGNRLSVTHPVVFSDAYNILYTSLPSMIDKIPVTKANSSEEDIFNLFQALLFKGYIFIGYNMII